MITSATNEPAVPERLKPRAEVRGRIRITTVLWLIVGLFALSMAWPALKGTYYKVSGIAPPDDGIGWRTDYAAALEESRSSGKPVLLDFTASWCPPCQVMKHEVWPDEAVRQAIAEGYIPVLLDVDQPGSAAAARRYDITGIPAIRIVNADGDVLRSGSYMSSDAMVDFLKAPASAG